MCVVGPHNLGKGDACALPVHPSRIGSSMALSPFQSQQNVSLFNNSQASGRCTTNW